MALSEVGQRSRSQTSNLMALSRLRFSRDGRKLALARGSTASDAVLISEEK
jgi:hypothetical protein